MVKFFELVFFYFFCYEGFEEFFNWCFEVFFILIIQDGFVGIREGFVDIIVNLFVILNQGIGEVDCVVVKGYFFVILIGVQVIFCQVIDRGFSYEGV